MGYTHSDGGQEVWPVVRDSVAYAVGGPHASRLGALYSSWASTVEQVITTHRGVGISGGTTRGQGPFFR
eukprot:9499689-Pyramimonas_sp.AAC.1